MLKGLLFRMPLIEASVVVLFFMYVYVFTDLIIESKYRGREHQELRAHHQHASSNVMFMRYAERGKSKAYGCKERADGYSRFYFFILYHINQGVYILSHDCFTSQSVFHPQASCGDGKTL